MVFTELFSAIRAIADAGIKASQEMEVGFQVGKGSQKRPKRFRKVPNTYDVPQDFNETKYLLEYVTVPVNTDHFNKYTKNTPISKYVDEEFPDGTYDAIVTGKWHA